MEHFTWPVVYIVVYGAFHNFKITGLKELGLHNELEKYSSKHFPSSLTCVKKYEAYKIIILKSGKEYSSPRMT